MLNENIKTLRKAKGLSQEELAARLHVVRQTVSKWEQGLSVPDADLLIELAEALDTPVSGLLGETIVEAEADDLKVLAEKLEDINLRLARRKAAVRRGLHWFFILLCAAILAAFAVCGAVQSPYLQWDLTDPETAVIATALHTLEWLFVRTAPFALVGTVVGICLTRRKK